MKQVSNIKILCCEENIIVANIFLLKLRNLPFEMESENCESI